MNAILIVATIIALATVGFFVNNSNKELASQVKVAKDLNQTKKRVVLESAYSASGEMSKGSLSQIKMSSLITGDVSDLEKRKIDALQRAIRISVIEEGNDSPSCEDLESTGEITKEDCESVRFKENNFASIENNGISLERDSTGKIIDIMENLSYFAFSNYDGDNITRIEILDKQNMDFKNKILEKRKRTLLKIEEIIKEETSVEALKAYGKIVAGKSEVSPLLSLKTLSVIAKKIESIDSAVISPELVKNDILIDGLFEENINNSGKDYDGGILKNDGETKEYIKNNLDKYKNYFK